MAAGTRTTDSEGVKLPVHPWVAAKARTHDAHAIAHRRAAQTRRIPLPSSSGSAEPATNAQTIGERTAGPMANRVTSPQPGAAAAEIGRPKISTACPPASRTPTTQGAQSSDGHAHGLRRLSRPGAPPARLGPSRANRGRTRRRRRASWGARPGQTRWRRR